MKNFYAMLVLIPNSYDPMVNFIFLPVKLLIQGSTYLWIYVENLVLDNNLKIQMQQYGTDMS